MEPEIKSGKRKKAVSEITTQPYKVLFISKESFIQQKVQHFFPLARWGSISTRNFTFLFITVFGKRKHSNGNDY